MTIVVRKSKNMGDLNVCDDRMCRIIRNADYFYIPNTVLTDDPLDPNFNEGKITP